MPEFLTTDEVAEMLRVSGRTIRRLCQKGDIVSVLVGGQVRITKEDLQTYLNNQRRVKNDEQRNNEQ